MTDLLNSILVPALVTGSLYSVVAVGFNVLERTTRVFNFAHGDLITLPPIATLAAIDIYHLPILLSFAAGVLCGVLASVLIELLCLRNYEGRPESFGWILSTLGVSVILEQAMSQPFQAQPVVFSYHLSLSPFHVQFVRISPQQLLTCGVAAVIFTLLFFFYRRTRLGKILRATGEDIDGARALGLGTHRAALVAMVIAALSAAAIGLVIAPLTLVTPTFGFGLTFLGFVAATLGGIGSDLGAAVGGYACGLIVQLVAVYADAVWTDAALFGCLVLLFMVRPQGALGRAPERRV
jgi:branched-chain amino acid transport system permease protein